MTTIRRARILLGTLVDIRIDGADRAPALEAIDAAFAEIATVHRLMSFHEDGSDVGRVNRDASRKPVAVDARTYEVIALALAFARASAGRFDPTVAAELVEWNRLPRPAGAPLPDPRADWRDVEMLPDRRIRCARPLWIDLGGIAKGYAVDRAIERLAALGIVRACVNAGGDLRRIGPGLETVHVRSPMPPHRPVRALQLGEGAMASSGGGFEPRSRVRGGPHVDATRRVPIASDIAVSVVADRCAVADALTKVVLIDAESAQPLLTAWNAEALVRDARGVCRRFGCAA